MTLVEYEGTPLGENTPQCGTLNARLQHRCQKTEETATAVSSFERPPRCYYTFAEVLPQRTPHIYSTLLTLAYLHLKAQVRVIGVALASTVRVSLMSSLLLRN